MEGCHGAKLGVILTNILSSVKFSKFTVSPSSRCRIILDYLNSPNSLVGGVEG